MLNAAPKILEIGNYVSAACLGGRSSIQEAWGEPHYDEKYPNGLWALAYAPPNLKKPETVAWPFIADIYRYSAMCCIHGKEDRLGGIILTNYCSYSAEFWGQIASLNGFPLVCTRSDAEKFFGEPLQIRKEDGMELLEWCLRTESMLGEIGFLACLDFSVESEWLCRTMITFVYGWN